MIRDRAWIAARIPHQGSMSLLDGVTQWTQQAITCHANSHRDADNPLRANGRLGIACGIEYAAQAMAVHGALLADANTSPGAGYLTSVREVSWSVTRLDDLSGELCVIAERLTGDANNILYAFSLTADTRVLMSGRAAVRLDAGGIT